MFPGAELRLHARRVQFETINGAVTHSAAVGRNQTRTPNLALAPRRHRGDETNRPAPRNVGNQASKFFSTEEQGECTEVTEKASMALRAVFDRALREAPSSFFSVS